MFGREFVFVIMELADKGTLKDYILNGKLSLDIKKHLLSESLNGLEYLHEMNIDHRDLSPDNILISSSTKNKFGITAKISDFGTSRVQSVSNKTVTKVIGKPKYMAPEVVKNFENANKIVYEKSSDIFGFGTIICFVIVEKYPFEKEMGNVTFSESYALIQIYNSKEFPNKYLKDINDNNFKEMIGMCWKINPKERISFKELKKRLFWTINKLFLPSLDKFF